MLFFLRKTRIFSSFLGNFLEFFEFSLYGFLVPVLSPLFFPSDKGALVSTLQAYLVFGVGFMGRPLGALLFGYLGDILGRRKALSFSILLMSFATVCIGLLPTYEQMGVYAGFTLALLRFTQGISAGGEYSGASLFSLESYPSKFHGILGGVLVVGCVSGSLFGALCAFLVQLGDASTLWRIPFIFCFCVGLLGFYIRMKLSESRDFQKVTKRKEVSLKFPLIDVLKNDFGNFLSVISVAGVCGSTHYFIFIFGNTYLRHFDYTPGEVHWIIQAALIFNIFALLWAGKQVNRFGYQRMLQYGSFLTFLVPIGISLGLKLGQNLAILLGIFAIALLNACLAAPSHAFMFRAFKANRRYSGTSFAYSIGICYIGGMTPYISTFLMGTAEGSLAPLYYLSLTGLFCWFCLKYVSNSSQALAFQSSAS